MKTSIARTVLATLLAFTISGCGSVHVIEQVDASTSPETTVEGVQHEGKLLVVPDGSPIRDRLVIETPREDTLEPEFCAPASVEADPAHFARVYPPLPGRIVEMKAKLGDEVKEGQVLVLIDSPDFNDAQSECVQAKSTSDLAEKTMKRTACLLEHGVASQKEMEQAKADYDLAQTDLERTRKRLKLFTPRACSKPGEPIAVCAPISGRVVELEAAKGEFKNDPATPFLAIADLSTVWLAADVQEKDVRHLHKGGPVSAVFAAYPEDTFTGSILFVGDMLDPQIRCVKVRVAFDNKDGRLKPGMFATATFKGVADTALTVPSTAVFQIDGATRVFVEREPWRYELIEVQTGNQVADRTIILGGLDLAQRFVAREGSLLR